MEDFYIEKRRIGNEYEDYSHHSFLIERRFLRIFESRKFDQLAETASENNFVVEGNIEVSFAPWMTMTYSLLYDSISKFILEAKQHGFVVHFEKENDLPEAVLEDEPKILTMYILSAGFYVWLGSIIIAFAAFICEHIHFYVVNHKQKEKVCTSKDGEMTVKRITVKPKTVNLNSQSKGDLPSDASSTVDAEQQLKEDKHIKHNTSNQSLQRDISLSSSQSSLSSHQPELKQFVHKHKVEINLQSK